MNIKLNIAGAAAGAVNGLLGTGGGMVLIPLMERSGALEKEALFSSSVAIILPLCLVSLGITALDGPLPWSQALPYLLGALPGGILAGLVKIPVKWLHRIFGALMILGGLRYLWM